jgi:hypothetical protein
VDLDSGFPYCIQIGSREDLVNASRNGAGSSLYCQHLIPPESQNIAPSPEILTLVRKAVPVKKTNTLKKAPAPKRPAFKKPGSKK